MDPSENHLRQNILTERWVIYAPGRAKRPQNWKQTESHNQGGLPERDSKCAFCPGNEKQLPEIIFELNSNEKDKWFTRTVPNKYPALTINEDIKGGNAGIYLTTTAYGRHEVIIESPLHNYDIPLMSPEHVKRIVETYVQRYQYIFNNFKEILNIIIFRNHGPSSGTSLIHPHSQIIGTGMTPKYIHDKETIASKYFEKNGRCPLCNILEFENHHEKRKIYESETFLCFVPFAAEVPFEVWICPKNHYDDFKEISEAEKMDLAGALISILSIFKDKLGDPDYNYIIHSSSRQKHPAPYLHWYLQIRPRTTTQAGFEIGSGMHINPFFT